MRRRTVLAAGMILLICAMMTSCRGANTDGELPAETTAGAESEAADTSAADTEAATEKAGDTANASGDAAKTGDAASTSGDVASDAAGNAGGSENSVSVEVAVGTPGAAPTMSLEEFPVIDGSLACVPMIEQLMVRFTGCSEVQADEKVNATFTNTNPCYLNLASGERDICIAYEPAQDTVNQLKSYDPLEMTPIGKDALVFIVNEDNPVDELTREQLTDIFTGKIHNWKEVGGDDVPIQVFTRPETSGSQTLMRKLLVGDADMTDEKYYYMQPTMEGMVEAIKEDYDNTEMAIGYSVYYYVEAMMGTSGLKFLKVDGVTPSTEAIAGGEYTLVNDFYAVLRGNSPENAVKIRDWLLTEEGQAFVAECGYVPVQ